MTTDLIINEADVLTRQATHLIGTLGHVAEGKSSFIRALTGVKTQRHAKEQDRNITIHLGYANSRIYQNLHTGDLCAGTPKNKVGDWQLIAHLSFVDCPGHEAYLATMLGGASIMDTACLIVAANQESIPQPQTVEHLIAAELMGLTHIGILQNKLDLLTPALARENREKITAFTMGTAAEGAPMMPISAQHGWGIDRVLEWLTSLTPPPRDLTAPARLTCVRSFDINPQGKWSSERGRLAGAVIGGTLDRGVLAVGDWIEVRPGVLKLNEHGEIVTQPLFTQVRGIRCESTDLPYAVPGSLIAISTDLDPALSIANGMLGQRIGVPATLPPIASQLTIRYKPLDRHGSHTFDAPAPGAVLTICSNVMTIRGTVLSTDDARERIVVALDRPLCIEKGERVGIMRLHEGTGRELLAGAGKVVRIYPWENTEEAEGADLVKLPDRTVRWVPMERPEWVVRTPPYEEMLESVMARKMAAGLAGKRRLEMPNVETERTKHYTNWTTYRDILTVLEGSGATTPHAVPYEKHFSTWLQSELRTPMRPTAEGVMEIRGRYRMEDLESLLRRYVATFKRCAQCNGYNTGLIKERVLKLRCHTCCSDNAIAE